PSITPDWEVLVVNDGSSDETGEVLTRCKGITAIHHPVNRGYGASLKTGIRSAQYDRVLFYDADGQFRREDIPALYEAAMECDMATGKRSKASDAPLLRRPGKKILSWTANYLVGQKIPDLNCGFRIVKREILLRYVHLLPQGFSASTTLTLLLLKEGFDVKFVPVTIERRVGTSTVNIFSDGFETLMLIVRLVTLLDPLRVFLTASGFFFVIGLAWGLRYYLQGRGISIATLFMLISGTLTFLIGLLADQVSALRREYHR
ncbi:MAG: glycosyltransferase family 2 protein, partial [Candidatus Eisenbacteria bacterium]|nr:glycosyltransferase family 2 protein [Candidatus Eisenbacteria bacterium]